MKTDTLFYRLFKNAPELALQLADLNDADTQNYRFSSEEIKQTAFRLDGILTPHKSIRIYRLFLSKFNSKKTPTFTADFSVKYFSICSKINR
ncbi:MAG: DUF2887 domain-containing protein [Methyloprofundus sp.]|nr:DUF2887 domain-containing protein [Methyloprofundus sp.]